jgi:hypothetical protein
MAPAGACTLEVVVLQANRQSCEARDEWKVLVRACMLEIVRVAGTSLGLSWLKQLCQDAGILLALHCGAYAAGDSHLGQFVSTFVVQSWFALPCLAMPCHALPCITLLVMPCLALPCTMPKVVLLVLLG